MYESMNGSKQFSCYYCLFVFNVFSRYLKSKYRFIWGVYFDAATGHSSQQQEINN